MNKQLAIDSLNDMPSDFELEDLMERLVVLEKIEKGRQDIDEKKIHFHEEAKTKLGKWLR